MCGIIGYSVADTKNYPNIFKKFLKFHQRMKYRGPDYSEKIKIETGPRVTELGFNRLSIQDLDNRANKIFTNENYSLLFNGEIYNKLHIKKKYFCDDKFSTKSDTEVLYKFLCKFKTEKIHELEGIFSIAFHDIKKNIFYLIKDFTGTKPLYYLRDNKNLFFSSEAWFLYSLTNKNLNFNALNFYFKFGFSPTSNTLIQNVKKIEPNSIYEFNLNNNNLKINKIINIFEKNMVFNKNSSTLRKTVTSTIEKNLIGNRAIGVYLSGGIDSSIISTTTKRINNNIEAYTSIYDDNNHSDNEDLKFTKQLCNDYNIKLHISRIKKKEIDTGQLLLNLGSFFDEPIANLNALASFNQAKMAKENNVSVVLTGDGSDEIFGGYRKYQILKYSNFFKAFRLFHKKINKYNSLKNEEVPSIFFDRLKDNYYEIIFNKEAQKKLNNESHLYFSSHKNKCSLLNEFDFKFWLPEEHNMKLDRSTMANSVEGRVPFQDIRILEYFNPNFIEENVSLINTKLLLRESFKDLPSYILKRKKKGWFLDEKKIINDCMNKNIHDLFTINNNKDLNIFNTESLENIFFSKRNSKFPKYEFITILMFKIWYNLVLEC